MKLERIPTEYLGMIISSRQTVVAKSLRRHILYNIRMNKTSVSETKWTNSG